MNCIDDDKYWSKRPLWKQLKYDHNKKSHGALRKLKGICMLFRTVNGNYIMKHKVNSANATLLYKASYIEKATPIHCNTSCIPCIVTPLVSYSNFANAMSL